MPVNPGLIALFLAYSPIRVLGYIPIPGDSPLSAALPESIKRYRHGGGMLRLREPIASYTGEEKTP